MAWYDTGTVSVTNGSTAVTGSGTNFIAGAQIGEAFYGPDGRLYEIQAIVSATSLTLADSYLGSTQTGQAYKIVPTQSLVATLASQVSELISDFQGVADEAGEGKFDDGSAASPGITFTLDQDTGFSRPNANQIGVSTAGVQRLLLTTTGLTSTVAFTGTTITATGDVTIPDKIIHSGDTDTSIRFPGNDIVTVETNGAERLRVTSTGNVGIGTSSPTTALTIISTDGNGISLGDRVLNGTRYIGTTGNGSLGGNSTHIAWTGDGVNAGNNITYSAFQSGFGGNHIFRAGTSGMPEVMRINSSGNVGIGTSSPGYRLEVYNNIDGTPFAWGNAARTGFLYQDTAGVGITNAAASGFDEGVYLNTADSNVALYTNSTERMRIKSDGEVQIAGTTDRGAFNLQVNGTGVWGAGAYTNGSDIRLKDNITDMPASLDVVKNLRPVTFTYKEDYSKDRAIQTGFIAQELQEALTGQDYLGGVVIEGGEHLSVAYQALIPVLTKAIQEQQATITALEARITALEAK